MSSKQDYCYTTEVIWAQIDANGHMRHSAYADVASQARMVVLDKVGLGLKTLYKLGIGPVLFREELVYHREVHLSDMLNVTCKMIKVNKDASRWTIYQELFRGDGVKAATVTIEGTWIDTKKRKMKGLEGEVLACFNRIPKSENFSSQ